MIKIYPAHVEGLDTAEQRLGSMLASDAAKLLKTYTYYTDDSDSPNGRGYQRPADPTRYPAIARDMRDNGATPIIISDRSRWDGIFGNAGEVVRIDAEDMVRRLSAAGHDDEPYASILDGQHRRGGAGWLLETAQIDVEIPFLLYRNLSWADEVNRFNTINTTAKNLPKALVEVNRMATFDEGTANTREKQQQHVREVVLALETDEDSIWYDQVNMTGGRNTDRPVTFEGLRRSMDATFAGRLAILSLPTKIKLAKTFWRVVAETWPDAWNDVPRTVEWVNPETNAVELQEQKVKYRIKDLAGVAALAKVGNQVLLDAYDPETGELNAGVVRNRLGRAKDINWVKERENPDMGAQAGFAGLADMYEMLLNRIYGVAA